VLETPHIIVAAAIAAKAGNPYLALPLALFSHFVLDEVPHWNPKITNKEGDVKRIDPNSMKIIIVDSTLALITGSAIALSYLPDIKKSLLVFACCFLAALPDIVEAPYIFLNYKKEFLRKWLFFQKKHQFNTNMFWGLITQIVTIIAAFWWMGQK
jgi:hypothetical protein